MYSRDLRAWGSSKSQKSPKYEIFWIFGISPPGGGGGKVNPCTVELKELVGLQNPRKSPKYENFGIFGISTPGGGGGRVNPCAIEF